MGKHKTGHFTSDRGLPKDFHRMTSEQAIETSRSVGIENPRARRGLHVTKWPGDFGGLLENPPTRPLEPPTVRIPQET